MTISTFNKHTIYKIQDLNLHDAEIAKITCDYNMHRIEIPVKLCRDNNSYKEAVIIFEDVQYADISFYEPWGAGIYINEVNVNDGTDIINRLVEYQRNSESFCLSILLNSGDRINILTSKVIYSDIQK
ncbi:hypothetical protein M972_11583 [Acetivibrio thermocellus AD2]|uniref:Uncharacterized protein n=2 Tax=Acetivibrio thermocellus TaxID=1515 RepID=A0AB36TDD0_ACETH|nr:hypothetical protein [Acetivibrio thermocellus]ADU73644.1 hypothetical protein Clo1313_0562 [Acetivibrio thermocellus DSM 1313]ALX07573.1 hypothetical protein AD2_00569 [Acetivibrio thermocellus AD2]ANV75313.1 hypothetical protein LQRI_0568 [Acetivibrio thermocellus DSM 2360]EIC03505.1 hypothetical protein YSBL_2820 [Acetivibrio thermocellus YS]CDG37498.1 hypothetical protein CTHBC1_2926 [Acetivibrio thermocellus BC1]